MVEFGLLAPIFLSTMMACLERSFDIYQRYELDQAAQVALRQIRVGARPSNGEAFKRLVCNALPKTMTCDYVVYDLAPVSDFNKVAWLKDNPGVVGRYLPGSSGQTVLLQLTYAAPVISPIWFTPTDKFTVSGKEFSVRFLTANAVARNE